MLNYHPDCLLLPIARLSGSREDAILEAACSIYWNRQYYIEYIYEVIGTPGRESLLLDCLLIYLRSEELIALMRVCAILHYSISMPFRWLVANSHKLAEEYNWSARSMGRAIDIIYDSMLIIQEDGSKFLEKDYILNIFQPLREVSVS